MRCTKIDTFSAAAIGIHAACGEIDTTIWCVVLPSHGLFQQQKWLISLLFNPTRKHWLWTNLLFLRNLLSVIPGVCDPCDYNNKTSCSVLKLFFLSNGTCWPLSNVHKDKIWLATRVWFSCHAGGKEFFEMRLGLNGKGHERSPVAWF